MNYYSQNMLDIFWEEDRFLFVRQVLEQAIKTANKRSDEYISMDHIAYGILFMIQLYAQFDNWEELQEIDGVIDLDDYEEIMEDYEYKLEYKNKQKVVISSIKVNGEVKQYLEVLKSVIDEVNLLLMLRIIFQVYKNSEIVMFSLLNCKEIYRLSCFEIKKERNERGLCKENFSQDKSYQDYALDITHFAHQGKYSQPFIGREKEFAQILRTLAKIKKNNPCLIGEPGVGKTGIVEELAVRISKGIVPNFLKNKRILSIDVAGIIAGSKYRGDMEEKIKSLLKHVVKERNIILFIDEIHMMVGAGDTSEGNNMDISNILKQYLARGEITCIGATTLGEYRKIEKDPALERRFSPIKIRESSEEESIKIIEGIKSMYEKTYDLRIPDDIISSIVNLSVRYITDRFLPDKAIDLLDESCAFQILENRAIVNLQIDSIFEVISEKTGVPRNRISQKECEELKELDKRLSSKVIGQQEAVKSISKIILRNRIGLADPERPIASFLFIGPTGVGKTELAKRLTEEVFGNSNDMIRIDMSELMEKGAVSKLIGAPPGYIGYNDSSQFSEKVRRKPYSVILLDEIEKAHPEVLHILLQVLDEGKLTDASGRVINFKNTIIIMTSNVGANNFRKESIGFSNNSNRKATNNVYNSLKGHFAPEFLNRIDEIIQFNFLDQDSIKQIADIYITELINRLANIGICCKVNSDVIDHISNIGYNREFGARELRRIIDQELKNKISEFLISNASPNISINILDESIHIAKTDIEVLA